MKNPLSLIGKGLQVLTMRLQTQGLITTLKWAYGRGMPFITGVPLLQYSQVRPYLFVGPQFRQRGLQFLQGQGIRACINMRIEYDDSAHQLALDEYLHLPTIDDAAPTVEHLDAGVAFIQRIVQAGGKVYIHCGAGVGRAPSMAAAYLMSEGLTLEEALAQIRISRPFITITAPQMAQLRHYETLLAARSQTHP